ncbi:hypothetical protein PCANC_14969 [Puccinia coronata f. sp. avenae]|uniref:DUF6818 domain-containing protein n=1 Tax=Puccinia coronata f. sp. avenae TaxID=200324 RepID=A0A2N5T2A1_9BASI|nr:hypothetical protein PCANC_14969 [Puccinia coronata f. sp. avenae]PLW51623.1 hypothetical protein PCASD_00591 [Puccinia coronata f. sp. avenae]
MAPTQRNNSTQSPAATQQTGVGTQTAPSSTNTSQRRPGRAKGAQGYTSADCTALVEAVDKHVLPLGANKWAIVHERYSKYALKNGQAIREQDSVKNKFCALVNLNKPTGDPDCPTWVPLQKGLYRLQPPAVTSARGDRRYIGRPDRFYVGRAHRYIRTKA